MAGKKIKPIKSYTTVNFDRQNPSLIITRIKDGKQVILFDIANIPYTSFRDDYGFYRPLELDKRYCADGGFTEGFKLTDIREGKLVKLIQTRDEIIENQLFLLLYELKCIRQAYFNS